MRINLALIILISVLFSCKKEIEEPIVENPYEDVSAFTSFVSPSIQREGDPVKGREYLLYGDYIDSGIPTDIFLSTLGGGEKNNELNRTGINADLTFGYTQIINDEGVSLVVANCMQCHAGYVDNQFILGLGNTFADFTSDQSAAAGLLDNFVVLQYGSGSKEHNAYIPFSRALKATSPNLITETVGSNPADKLALVLAAHRDANDLTWKDDIQFEIPEETPPSDVPAWWLLKKKNAMFNTGLGQGDFAKHMMTASILTLKDTVKANEVDEKFADVLAFIKSIEAPAYPGSIDEAKADQGALIFQANCAKCHGTYGETPSYPNLFVQQSLLDTDPYIALGTSKYSDFVNWFNNSWFAKGETGAEYKVVDGYIAPPLDGIWATAPYFHNGSVPTLKHVLDSASRPKFWRKSSSKDNYDHENIGLSVTIPESKTDKYTYDTSLLGYSNKGHYFADYLSDLQKEQLLEYLKKI